MSLHVVKIKDSTAVSLLKFISQPQISYSYVFLTMARKSVALIKTPKLTKRSYPYASCSSTAHLSGEANVFFHVTNE